MDKVVLIKKIEKEARKFFEDADGCHDWTHVDRVRNLAIKIGKEENVDMFILEASALLHDIGRKEEMLQKGKVCHAELGEKLAREILFEFQIDEENIGKISHCILTHRYRNSYIPETKEAKVLFDADKLDSIGAIGIARDFLFAGNAGSNTLYTGNERKLAKSKQDYAYSKEDSAILEYEVKLKFVKDKMLTESGKRMADERDRYMRDFFNRFWEEVNGKI